jgi:hypothetical protein
MKNILIIAAFLVLSFYAEKTYAFSCIETPLNTPIETQVTESLNKSSAVFTAKVLSASVNKKTFKKDVKLLLIKSWKGKRTKTVIITTASNSAACGFNFEVGQKYIIYAYRDSNKKLSTNLCTRTAALGLNNDAEILDKLKKKN